jgi:glutamine synthetase
VPALRAADEAVAVREIVRETARLLGCRRASPRRTAAAGVGNGVHVHFSSATQKAGRPHSIRPGRAAALMWPALCSGILDTARLVALTARASSPICAQTASLELSLDMARRARPRGDAAHLPDGGDRRPRSRRPQFNLEFRAADASASPYLV